MKNKPAFKNCLNMILAYFAVCALTINLDYITADKNEGNIISQIIQEIKQSFTDQTVVSLILFFLFFLLFSKVYGNLSGSKKGWIMGLSWLLAFFQVAGYSFEKVDSWYLVFGNWVCFGKSFVVYVGYTAIFYACLSGLYVWLTSKSMDLNYAWFSEKLKWFDGSRKCFFILWGILLILWLPYLIAFYPGVTSGDTMDQLRQFFGQDCWTARISKLISEDVLINNHHPVIHTWIFGLCMQTGKLFSHDNWGVFIYAIGQSVLMAGVFSYSLCFLLKKKIPAPFVMGLGIFYGLWPFYPMWAICMGKDTSYAFWNVLYMILLMELVFSKGGVLKSRKFCVALFFTNLLVLLTRNNGKYAVIICFFVVLCIYRKYWKQVLGIFVVSLGLYTIVFMKIVLPYFSISTGSTRETIGILFQHTARYILEYPGEIAEEDLETIDKVMAIDQIDKYYKVNHGTIKSAYRKGCTKEERNEYLKVWFKYFLKRPDVYVQATMNISYGYFYPQRLKFLSDAGSIGFFRIDKRIVNGGVDAVNIQNPVVLSPIRWEIKRISELIACSPVLSLISSLGMHAWLMLIGIVFFVIDKRKECLCFYTPVIVNTLVCLLAPKVAVRYGLSLLFSMPIILVVTISVLNPAIRQQLVMKESSIKERA